MTDKEASAIVDAHDKRHAAWLARPLTRSEWIELLLRCQDGQCTCMFVLEKIEREIEMAEGSATCPDCAKQRAKYERKEAAMARAGNFGIVPEARKCKVHRSKRVFVAR